MATVNINIYHIIIAFGMGSTVTLFAVALGGLLVFKTKREPHESLFSVGSPKADAFVLDPLDDELKENKNKDIVPDIVKAQTDKFLNQMKGTGGVNL